MNFRVRTKNMDKPENIDITPALEAVKKGGDPFPVRLNNSLYELSKIVGARRGYIFVDCGEKDKLVIMAACQDSLIGSYKQLVPGSILERVLRSGNSFFLRDRERDGDFEKAKKKNRSVLAEPIISASGQVLGILWLSNQREDPPFAKGLREAIHDFCAAVSASWEGENVPMLNTHPEGDILDNLFSAEHAHMNSDLRGLADLVDGFTREKEEEETWVQTDFLGEKEPSSQPSPEKPEKIKRTYYLRRDTLKRLEEVQKTFPRVVPDMQMKISKSWLVDAALKMVILDFEGEREESMLAQYIQRKKDGSSTH